MTNIPVPPTNHTQTTAILVAIGVVVVAGAGGATFAHENAGQIIAFCTLIAVSLLGLLQQAKLGAQQLASSDRQEVVAARVEAHAETAAVNTTETKQLAAANSGKLDNMSAIGVATHALVNNEMAVQLRMTAELARWKANQTHLPEDIRMAETAERLSHEHDVKQAAIDALTASQDGKIKVVIEGERIPPVH